MDEWWKPLLEPDGLLIRERVLAEVDPDALLVALRSCRLRRVQRGIYMPRNIDAPPLTIARAAILSSAVPRAVASHDTAARIHGIAVPETGRREHVTVPGDVRKRDRRELVFHNRALELGDVEVRQGIPVTTVPRTLADLAADRERLSAVWALDDAFRRGLCPPHRVEQAIARWRGGTGCVRAKAVFACSDGRAESILETAARLTLADAGLPLPRTQFEVFGADGRLIARLDGAFPEERVGLEFDGRSVHSAPEALFRDRTRQNDLVELGWVLLRFTWWDVVDQPKGFVESVSRTVGARRGTGVHLGR
ncbi:hypothetical protein NLX83_16950 [Allokutzneria sp. A3M-2-11 16]|uniref:hypothetical protein n=1 Tax=Allokutzneria sp. A3M-2-11 16 TaxID=2962043 RepID=UPI0020B70DFC|nr:hypothetical protein [Allokutzneria sp. A3M-2-11 16]MCP3800954.1 hypothetical protein [Allokutzneria sp. A3M-2-11 16]